MAHLGLRQYGSDELEPIAKDTLEAQLGWPPAIPVDIDLVAERMGAEIIPIPNLERDHGIHGLLCRDVQQARWVICIDEWLFDEGRKNRYRFTMAEEVAHIVLHGEAFASIKSVGEYRGMRDSLSGADNWLLERNARRLASALLMPAASVIEHVQAFGEMLKNPRGIVPESLTAPLREEYAIRYIGGTLRRCVNRARAV